MGLKIDAQKSQEKQNWKIVLKSIDLSFHLWIIYIKIYVAHKGHKTTDPDGLYYSYPMLPDAKAKGSKLFVGLTDGETLFPPQQSCK